MPKFKILQEILHGTYLLELLYKMYKYEMDPTRTVGTTEHARDAGRTDGWTDGQTDGVKLIYPQKTLLCRSIISNFQTHIQDRYLELLCKIALWWMAQDLIDDASTVVYVMAWTSHDMNQCWPSPIMPYGVIRPQWLTKSVLSLRRV